MNNNWIIIIRAWVSVSRFVFTDSSLSLSLLCEIFIEHPSDAPIYGYTMFVC